MLILLYILSHAQDGAAVLERFLTGDTYIKAQDSTLTPTDWELRKAAILVKSYFFNNASTGAEDLEKTLREVNGKC